MATKPNTFYLQGGLPAASDLDATFHLAGAIQLGFPAGAQQPPSIVVAQGNYTLATIPGAALAAYRAHTGLVMVTEATAKGMLIRDTLLVMRDLNYISSQPHHNSQLQGPPLDACPSYDPQSVADRHDPGWLYFSAGLGAHVGYTDAEVAPHLQAGANRHTSHAQCVSVASYYGAMPPHCCRKWHA